MADRIGVPDRPPLPALSSATTAGEVASHYDALLRAAKAPLREVARVPAVGFLTLELIREVHPDLDDDEIERLRKNLQYWRDEKGNEDKCFKGEEDPKTGRRRWGYPAATVEQFAKEVRAKRIE